MWVVTEALRLHPQLQAIERELALATTRAARLVDQTSESAFHRPPQPGHWSVGECLVHLSLTTQAYLPLIDDTLQIGRLTVPGTPARYRRDLTGWLLCRISEPPYRLKASTQPRFVPRAIGTRAEVLTEFVHLQQELTVRVHRAEGLELGRLRIVSPFDDRLEYSLYSAFRIIPAHQRRHLWQGERIHRMLPASASSETRADLQPDPQPS
jgi:DinB family protein